MNNNQKLALIKEERDLKHSEIASLCRVSLATVNSWFYYNNGGKGNPMPDSKLELLELKLNSD